MKSLSVLNKLKEKGLQISFAESMTGGKIVSELIKHPSASSVCSLGIVTYSDKVKNSWLDVPLETIRKYGVSEAGHPLIKIGGRLAYRGGQRKSRQIKNICMAFNKLQNTASVAQINEYETA